MPAEASVDISLRWRDLDMLGHLNQAVYHELLEEARGALIASLGEHFAFVLVRVELDYMREVRHTDKQVRASARVERVGTKSFTVTQEITLPDGTAVAKGTSVLVAWDPRARGSRALTEAERAALEA